MSRDCKWCTSPHRSVGISVEENKVAIRKGQSLRKQNISARFLTGFTSKANSTCCMSGDTWYLAALDLSWMGYRQKYRHTHIRNTLSTAADSKSYCSWRKCTHKQLVWNDNPLLQGVNVKLDNIPFRCTIQQLIVFEWKTNTRGWDDISYSSCSQIQTTKVQQVWFSCCVIITATGPTTRAVLSIYTTGAKV